ncbi:MAG: hypothetical protein ACKOUM_07100 [Sphingopyxis sp.]
MILPLIALQVASAVPAASAPPPASASASAAPSAAPTPAPAHTLGIMDQARFDECHDQSVADPAAGVMAANEWLLDGGGYIARQCLGFAYAKQGMYDAAREAFAQAAHDAETAHDWRSANLWAQAGNAALADWQTSLAREYINAALAQGRLTGVQLGEAYLDRARAALQDQDWASARADLTVAAQHAPQDPLLWLLSAKLARRQDDLARAQADIQVATTLAPQDPAIALEAGNIAAFDQRLDAARQSWQSAITLAPDGPAAAAARIRLTALDAYEAEGRTANAATPAAPATPSAPATITAPPPAQP